MNTDEINIFYASKLQEEGVVVVFGVPGLKVHSKLFLITQKADNKIIQYANIGTGNFNENTAKTYCDHTLLTSDKKIKVKFGPAMRTIIDFSNIENGLSVLPTGESGNLMSTNYKNQAPIYNNGKLRGQKMNREEILSKKSGRLLLTPSR